MRSIGYVVCDVFTRRPLAGNSLTVFTDAHHLDDGLMQALAREMISSESVFVSPPAAGGLARVRIFTTAREVPFAGHPLLGAAFVLAEAQQQASEIVMETRLGSIPVRLQRDGGRATFGWMRQPLPIWGPYAEGPALLKALGLAASVLPIEMYDNGLRHVFVAAPTRNDVATLRPDLARMKKLPGTCFCVFAGEGSEWKARVFAPAGGVDEDPATGASAGPLAIHLARYGRVSMGTEVHIVQGAEVLRPSQIFARCTGSTQQVHEVEVGGAAVVVARGEFQI